ncbi:unnamed protein product [Paramecium pentaurelia]|uniref:Uncharacterized protein n=1 Tax=Paramecium pentaurelia TaxID=43138 RepID=A0A8S1WG93_9CILI|nr:unnamed protein product [Paramecium pentaurelia]
MNASINQYNNVNKLSFEEKIIQVFYSYNMIKVSNLKKYKQINQSKIGLLDYSVKLIFQTNDNQKPLQQTFIFQIQQISSLVDLSLLIKQN